MPVVEYTAEKGLVQKSGTTASLDLQGQLFGHRSGIKSVSGATSLTVADSGKTILVTASQAGAAYDIALPRLNGTGDEGTCYKFILVQAGNAAASDVTISVGHADDDFVGHIVATDGVDTAAAGDEDITFDQNAGSLAGDTVELFSDGTKWFVRGQSAAVAGLAFVGA
jgi:hypothetical protein